MMGSMLKMTEKIPCSHHLAVVNDPINDSTMVKSTDSK